MNMTGTIKIKDLQEIYGKISDDIPVDVYRKLVEMTAKKIPGGKEFAPENRKKYTAVKGI